MARCQKQAEDTAETGDLDSIVENRRHTFGEGRDALCGAHDKREAARRRQNVPIIRLSTGVQEQQEDWVHIKGLFCEGLGEKPVRERWTGP